MDKKKFNRTISQIKIIEQKKEELYQQLNAQELPSRKDLKREISQDILYKSTVFEELGIPKKGIQTEPETDIQPPLIEDIINDLSEKIKNNKSKKVIYLKKFLELFREIHENDKAVLLQSLEREEDIKMLIAKMKSLANSFQLTI